MTTKLTTAATRAYYADAISDAIAEAEAILGPLIVTRIGCVIEIDPTYCGTTRATRYKATVDAMEGNHD